MELATIKINSAAEANAAHKMIVGSVWLAVELGEYLIRQKSTVGHGGWEKWVGENLDFGSRYASKYMFVASESYRLPNRNDCSDLSFDAGFKFLLIIKNWVAALVGLVANLRVHYTLRLVTNYL